MLKKSIDLLSSKKLALFLFFSLAIFLIPGTLLPSNIPLYNYSRFTLLALFLTNLVVCSLTRFKSLHSHTLVIHLGCILTLLGSMAGSFGYILTTNLYLNASTTTAYNWDRETETPLGFELKVQNINEEYYPVLVKIGVKNSGKKAALFQVKTGESFNYKEYRVDVETLDVEKKSITLGIYQNGILISHYQTTDTETKEKIKELPLTFKLVAFKNPILKAIWLDLEVTQDGKTTYGISAVNQPFIWHGLRLFHTATGHDPYGTPYAGIQIVRDPGIPLVYLGFITILLGCFLLLRNKSKTRK